MIDTVASGSSLDRECVAFAKYLTGGSADGYVRDCYRAAHERGELAGLPEPSGFERALVRLATIPVTARVVDVYTALFMKRALVRRKLVLVLAILESCAPSYRYFENPDGGGTTGVLARLVARSIASTLALLASILVVAPTHLASTVVSRAQRSK
jgi:hypothetical protein